MANDFEQDDVHQNLVLYTERPVKKKKTLKVTDAVYDEQCSYQTY